MKKFLITANLVGLLVSSLSHAKKAHEIIVRSKVDQTISEYIILSGDDKLTFSHPHRGALLKAELRARSNDGWIIAGYALDRANNQYRLVSLMKAPFRVFGFSTADEKHCSVPKSLAVVKDMLSVAEYQQQVDSTAKALQKRNILDTSCQKEPFAKIQPLYYQALAKITTPRDKPLASNFLQCLSNAGFPSIGAEIQIKLSAAVSETTPPQRPPFRFVCSAEAEQFSYNEATKQLIMAEEVSVDSILERMTHELAHSPSCGQHTFVENAVNCCNGDGTGTACGHLTTIAEIERERTQSETKMMATALNGPHKVALQRMQSGQAEDCMGKLPEQPNQNDQNEFGLALAKNDIQKLDGKVVQLTPLAPILGDEQLGRENASAGNLAPSDFFGPTNTPTANTDIQVASASVSSSRAPASVMVSADAYIDRNTGLAGIVDAFRVRPEDIRPQEIQRRRVTVPAPRANGKKPQQAVNLIEQGIVLAALPGLATKLSAVTEASTTPEIFALISLPQAVDNPLPLGKENKTNQATDEKVAQEPSRTVNAAVAERSAEVRAVSAPTQSGSVALRSLEQGVASQSGSMTADFGRENRAPLPELIAPLSEIKKRVNDKQFIALLERNRVQIVDEIGRKFGAKNPKQVCRISQVSNSLVCGSVD